MLMREQAELMRESASAPFQSNLQDRVISACADFTYHADRARAEVTLWGAVKRKNPGVMSAGKIDERQTFVDAVKSLVELRPKVQLLSFFSEGGRKTN